MHTEIVHLFSRYIQNQCDPDEIQEVLSYIEQGLYLEEWELAISKTSEHTDTREALSRFKVQAMHQRIRTRIRRKGVFNKRRIGIAAALLLSLCLGLWVYDQGRTPARQSMVHIDVLPGGNKATLQLSGGQQIVLSEKKTGIVVGEDHLAYSDGTELKGTEGVAPQYATLKTPKGGQYQLTLSDGTKVWLNAASSIEYPSAFLGEERRVKVIGEAYFEVAHNAQMPFRVETQGQLIEVLGTHFNVQAYPEEAVVRTTLLEGRVKVRSQQRSEAVILEPNQQSIFYKERDRMKVEKVDTRVAVGWKSGLMYFDNTDLKAVLRQLGRWYDVEVDLNEVPDKQLNGVISREVNLSLVLDAIKHTSNVQLQIEGLPNGQGRRIRMK